MSTDSLGLRERKKLRTRETLARVALELFERQGFRATTITEIADAADVAPRTVSAYFPAKDDLVFPDHHEHVAALRARLADRHPGETAIDALRAWIMAELPRWQAEHEQLRARRRVIDADEGLRARERAHQGEFEDLLATVIAGDLGLGADDPEPRMAAAATIAIFGVLERQDRPPARAPEGPGDEQGPYAEEDVLGLLDRALRFVTGGIAALGAP